MESNNGSQFFNTNRSRNFRQNINTSLVGLSAAVCSEVLVINRSGSLIYLYDNEDFSDDHCLAIDDGESIVIRGISNCDSLSAKTESSSGDIYYRASNFSNYNQG